MNAISRVLQDCGLNAESHSDPLLYAMLVYMSTDYESSDVETNPVREVVRRLEARGVGKIALDIVHQKLNTLEEKYDRGQS